MRFGNKAFRTWHGKLTNVSSDIVEAVVRAGKEDEASEQWAVQQQLRASATGTRTISRDVALQELAMYLCDSFGNATRLDYGTGHETNFILWMLCLRKCGALQASDHAALGLAVFPQYLAVCRALQRTYWLEPAGSHGVWSLDDFQMVPFVWGSAQLIGHETWTPSSIHSADVRSEAALNYMYFAAIEFIYTMKTGGLFAEHSPLLNDISALHSWEKVNTGMLRMYEGEVLGKRPITQHILFGELLPKSWHQRAPSNPLRLASTNPAVDMSGSGIDTPAIGQGAMPYAAGMATPAMFPGGVPMGMGTPRPHATAMPLPDGLGGEQGGYVRVAVAAGVAAAAPWADEAAGLPEPPSGTKLRPQAGADAALDRESVEVASTVGSSTVASSPVGDVPEPAAASDSLAPATLSSSDGLAPVHVRGASTETGSQRTRSISVSSEATSLHVASLAAGGVTETAPWALQTGDRGGGPPPVVDPLASGTLEDASKESVLVTAAEAWQTK